MVIAIPSRCLADEAFRQSSGVIEKWVRMRIRVKSDDATVGSVPRGWGRAGRTTPLASVCKIYERTRRLCPCPGQPTE